MPSVTRKPQAKRQERREQIERRLLDATERLMADGASFTELSVDRLATEAGISRASFYIYFEDKGASAAPPHRPGLRRPRRGRRALVECRAAPRPGRRARRDDGDHRQLPAASAAPAGALNEMAAYDAHGRRHLRPGARRHRDAHGRGDRARASGTAPSAATCPQPPRQARSPGWSSGPASRTCRAANSPTTPSWPPR